MNNRGPATPGPPRLPAAILRRAVPPGPAGETAVRDLEREYRALASERARPPRAWYWREALLLSAHFALHRARRGAGRAPPERRTSIMDRILQDVSYAFRVLRRDPGFSIVAVLTIALGIGATVSIFSVVDAVLLRPLPYEAPDRLVALWEWNLPRDNRTNVLNPGNFRDWRDRAESFEDMAALTMLQPLVIEGRSGPEEVRTRLGSANFFPLLGMRPRLGRWPVVDEEVTQVVLSHEYWRRGWGGDPGVVGRTVTINGEAAEIVGVGPADYVVFGEETDVFAAIPLRGDQTSTGRYLVAVGRLKEGVSVEAARDEMEAIAAGLREEYPEFNAGWSVNVVPLREQVMGDARTTLWFLMGSVGLLLLIACANVANLFLARATDRQREMAVRTSLGASGGRLGGQLIVESLVLAGLGALLGMALARLGTGIIAGALPEAFAIPRMDAASLDGRVLLFAGSVTLLTGLLFGLVPALEAAGTAPAATLGAEGRAPSRRTSRFRAGLVVGEVALAVVLLTGASLLGRSFATLAAVDPGIDPENVVTGRVALVGPAYQGEDPDRLFYGRLAEGLRSVPGFDAAGGITWLPLTGLAAATSYVVEGRPRPPREDWPVADVRNVIGDYFQAAGVELLRGRLLDERDRTDTEPVVVISRAMAERQWPGEDPLGQRILLSWDGLEPLQVVGVVEDVRHYGLDEDDIRDMVYLAYEQKPYFGSMNLVVRSSMPPERVEALMAERVHALDPSIPLSDVRTMEGVVAASVARPRMIATLTAVFASLAALLAAVGLYGVLAYAVSRRVREMGVRMALGAERADVMGLVTRQGLTLVAVGLVIGFGVALAGGRVVESLLFRLHARDPVSMAAAGLLLLTVGTAACLVPAWRATRVSPSEALREE